MYDKIHYKLKKKKLCDSLYCNICFIAAVWSHICHVSQVCLILKTLLHCLWVYVVFDKESSVSFIILLLYEKFLVVF